VTVKQRLIPIPLGRKWALWDTAKNETLNYPSGHVVVWGSRRRAKKAAQVMNGESS